MKKLILLLSLFTTTIVKAQDTAKADAKLTAATVYFGSGAELTQEAKVNVNSGIKQIVISQLSTLLDLNSLQISVPEDVALLSQKFLVYTPTVPVVINPMIKKWQDSIVMVQKDISRNDNLIDIEATVLEKTGTLIQLTLDKTDSKTISADDALKLINFYTAKIEKSKTSVFNLNLVKNQLREQITKFQTQINEAAYKPVKAQKSYGQLILQVICSTSGEIPVTFSYYTSNAGWTPLYDVRVNSKSNEIKLVYKASVTQSTGIDWKKTKLTLSTANPNWGTETPLLLPWYLQQSSVMLLRQMQPVVNNYYQNNIQSIYADDSKLKEEVVTSGYGVKKTARSLAYSTQTVDPSNLNKFTTLSESQLNTNFEIDLPYEVESDGQIHSVTIKEEKINATLKSYAVPKLDKDAYLLAEISEWESLDLLPGIANIIMDDTYLGKSLVDPNSTSDTLNLSLGKDKRVAVKRKPVKEYTSTKTTGSTTKQIFTYETTVKNNKTTEVTILLKDQYPISTIKDIEVKLDDSKDASVNEENGVLTWKITLKPGESKKVRFSYTVKYPKDIKIQNL